VNGITSFDAALVAQHVAGLITLTSCQQIAGDASDNGSLSSFDASLIAQTAAGIPNSGIAGTWRFVPSNRSYPILSGDLTNQNYDTVLIGDVSGNWVAPGAAPSINSESLSPTAQLTVSLPNASDATGTTVTIPVLVGDLTGGGAQSYDFSLVFDSSVLQLLNPSFDPAGTLSKDMVITPNSMNPGRLIVSAFGTSALSGTGTLLNLKFNVSGAPGTTTTLTFERFLFNEGTPSVAVVNGSFTVTSASSGPRIIDAMIQGKNLIVIGERFDEGAVILLDTERQKKTRADEDNPTTRLIGKKVGKKIASGQTVTLEVRNSDGSVSNRFSFTRQ
jgi:hypothetical protein